MSNMKVIEKLKENPQMPIWHSAEHVLQAAMRDLYPSIKYVMGPPIEDGFYFDFDLDRSISIEDFPAIEKKMSEIIKADLPITMIKVSENEAKEMFAGNDYKLENIASIAERGEEMTVCVMGDVENPQDIDLCMGHHVEKTGDIKAFKLLNIAGAYYKGDESKKMLQRIYGTAFNSKEKLKEHLYKLEEAKKRDHRKLGRELDLFSVNDEVGSGLVLWHPKGAMVRFQAERFWENEHLSNGYEFVYTPHIGKSDLWETSGHLGFYAENMYSPIEIEDQKYYLKPMNCPFHIEIYKSDIRSYRDLPMRLAEKGTVYRYERSGVMHGLMRVRGFTQDDAHHFCAPSQMPDEIDFVLSFSLNMLRSFGFDEIKAFLSTRPEKAVGEPEQWHAAEDALEAALKRAKLPYEVDNGGGAFYGPKIDLKIKDAIGREWQLSTIQFDFNLPERFDMTYIEEDGQQHRPYMIHRALLGSIERFFGVLIEHYGGAFPVWLAPVQVSIVPISDKHLEYANKVRTKFEEKGMRVEVNDKDASMGAKIREAQKQKIPYMIVVGDKEVEDEQVSVRLRSGEQHNAQDLGKVIETIEDIYLTRSLKLW